MDSRHERKMSGIHSFHPESVSTDELRLQLKTRLPSVNLEEMNREQLVKIFKNYASPIPKRSSGTLPLANGKEQHNQLAAGQHSVQLKRKPETNLEKSTDLCKKRKYSNDKVADATTANRKRQHNGDVPMSCAELTNQTKRKKITWP